MPRNYERKTKSTYNIDALQRAVEDVKSKKLSLGQAAIIYSVPKTTIFDQLKNVVIIQPKYGRKSVFSNAQEEEFEKYIIGCSEVFYGLTIDKVRKIAFSFAEKNKLKHNFDKTFQMAGKDWYYGFIKRHPNISLKKPDSTSLNRVTAFNKTEVKSFFNNLESLQRTHHFDGDHIYNVDETGITNIQRNSRILAPKSQKQVGMTANGERGTTITVVCAFSASGNYIPPFFIFKRKRLNGKLLRGGAENMIAAVSDSGWIDENLFVDWLQHFISFSKPSKESPILLVLDNHESHVSLDCYELCRQHGIHLLSLPPHTSHIMQPLALTYFGPLKTAYNRECDIYMTENIGRRITQYEVVELFTKAFNRISNLEKASKGFRAAGIFPLDPNKFDDFFTTAITEAAQPEALFNMQTSLDEPKATINQSVLLSDIVPLPTLPQNNTKQNCKKKHSIIITPMKEVLRRNKEKKDKKEDTEVTQNEKKKNDKVNKKCVMNLKTFDEENLVGKADEEPKKKKKRTKNVDKEIIHICIYCDEMYTHPPTEDWITCYKCNLWAHEKCSGSSGSTSRGFLCDFCDT